ncbi:VOC family protein [Neomicrococcus lactis]|uniref:VOC family protein n=1 Tax=Neomicrococcus lactis TaxID=732241 RepID=UPI0023008A54|nr:VOC family protein [Neomicrococcus lactis]
MAHIKSSSDGLQMYWDTPDITDHLERLVAAGGTMVQEPNDVGGGMLVGTIKDSNGSVVGLRQLPTA